MPQTLLIVRGLPGSGKSTFARTVAHYRFEADDYFIGKDGVYRWEPEKLAEAHSDCLKRVRSHLIKRAYLHDEIVVVANVFVRIDHMLPYLKLAADTRLDGTPLIPGLRVHVVDLFDRGKSDATLAAANAHGVPVETIARMRREWER